MPKQSIAQIVARRLDQLTVRKYRDDEMAGLSLADLEIALEYLTRAIKGIPPSPTTVLIGLGVLRIQSAKRKIQQIDQEPK